MTYKSTLEANPANLISLNGVESTRRLVVVDGDAIFDGATVAIYAWTDGQENGRIILAIDGVFYLPNTLDSFIILRLDPNQSYSNGGAYPNDNYVYNRTWGNAKGNYHTFTFTGYSAGDNGYYLEGIWS